MTAFFLVSILKEDIHNYRRTNLEKTLNKFIGIVGILLLILVACVAAYVVFLSVTEYTPDEITLLEVENNQEAMVTVDTPLTAVTYNLGFGAYAPEFDFFMDGGTGSTAKDSETVVNNITGSINTLLEINPDFLLLQEVDRRSTRSHFINQYEMIYRIFSDYGTSFAPNFDVKWIAYPFTDMHGKTYAGQTTLSNKKISSSERITLPTDDTWPARLVALDRCMLVSRIPTSDEKELVIVNVHLSAYDKDGTFRKEQLRVLSEFLEAETAKENYIIVGGDFNHLLPPAEEATFNFTDEVPTWITSIPEEFTPTNFSWQVDPSVPTIRDTATPFKRGETFVSIVDGFLVSNNVRVSRTETINLNFKYSDHHPTYIQFELKPKRKRARP